MMKPIYYVSDAQPISIGALSVFYSLLRDGREPNIKFLTLEQLEFLREEIQNWKIQGIFPIIMGPTGFIPETGKQCNTLQMFELGILCRIGRERKKNV